MTLFDIVHVKGGRSRELLLKKQIPANPDTQCLKDMLAMIRTLQRSELDAGFVKPKLGKWFNKYYAQGVSDVNYEIRRAVCYVDWLLNRPAPHAGGKGESER